MKKADISILARQSRSKNGQETPPLRTNCTPLTDKSQTKFSRKPETYGMEYKRQSCKQIEVEMRYISPGRICFSQALLPSCPSNLSFQQISHKFPLNGNEPNLLVSSTAELVQGKKKESEYVSQRTTVAQKIETKGNIAWAKEKNLVWKRETNNLQSLKDVLAQEQRLDNILRENTRLTNALGLKSKQNQALLQQVANLRKEVTELKQQITKHSQTQQLVIQRAMKAEKQLSLKSLHQKIFLPSHKENNPHNRSHLIKRPKLKCNSFFQNTNSALDQDNSNTRATDSHFKLIKQLFPNKSISLVHSRSQTPEEPHSKKQLTKLKEKLRYCEIEIDILRRTRMGKEQQATDNQQLRKTNRKLMERLSFLRKTSLRRSRIHSDSSLSLSLSPIRF